MCCRLGLALRPVTSRHVVCVSVPLFHVTAVVGEPVYLPCDITTDPGDAVLLVLWYREDLGTPIYRSVNDSVSGVQTAFSIAVTISVV